MGLTGFLLRALKALSLVLRYNVAVRGIIPQWPGEKRVRRHDAKDTPMKKKGTIIVLSLLAMGMMLNACGSASSTSTPPAPAFVLLPESTATMLPPTPSPTPWPLQVELGEWSHQISREKLLELVPGKSTLQDLYALVGLPSARADFPSGVALRYASELGKLPHAVLVDGVTGKVLFVAIDDFSKNFFYLSGLTYKYGNPVLAVTINTRDHLFFTDAGMAIIADEEDHNDIWYGQFFPKEMTLDDYRSHQGFMKETFAFTP